LLDLLDQAFESMSTADRHAVFGETMRSARKQAVDGPVLLGEVEAFCRESRQGAFYAPFSMNSKNYTHVPEATSLWFDRLGDFLADSAELSKAGGHDLAVKCFGELYEIIAEMEQGDEIVFAHEFGTWMIPGGEGMFLKHYLASLAATCDDDSFAAAALPLVKRDSRGSFVDQVYGNAKSVATKGQMSALDKQIKAHKVRMA